MNPKNIVWKVATAFVVMIIILNPETIELALFIDAIGLEMFLILFEIQLMAIFGLLLNNKCEIALANLKQLIQNHIFEISWKSIKEEFERLVFAVPSQATLMYLLVFSSVTDTVIKSQF